MQSKLMTKVVPDSGESNKDVPASKTIIGSPFQNWLSLALNDFGFSVLLIGDTAPDFEADTTIGRIRFHEWIGDSWCVLFSHPKNFTPVCTTELGYVAHLHPEFESRNCKVIGLSVDSVEDHATWGQDIADVMGKMPGFPIIGDPDLRLAKLYGMLPASGEANAASRTALDNMTVRTIHVISPEKKIKAMLTYPMSSGRNFYEVLRLIDSLQLSAGHNVVTPAHWKPGEDVIISPSLSHDEALRQFPEGWVEAKPYLRFVRQPTKA